jgi:hypothetical protein
LFVFSSDARTRLTDSSSKGFSRFLKDDIQREEREKAERENNKKKRYFDPDRERERKVGYEDDIPLTRLYELSISMF